MSYNRHIFAVPTHRAIPTASLDGFFSEIRQAREAHGVDLPLVIVDDDGASNEAALARHRAARLDVQCIHFSPETIARLYRQIAQELDGAVRSAFRHIEDRRRPNYGNTYNKLYIVAALLGAKYIHRRDADTLPQAHVDETGAPRALHPIELELKYLGRTVDGKQVELAGGGYVGRWALDLEHLVTGGDARNLRRFYRLNSVSPEECETIQPTDTGFYDLPYRDDSLSFHNGVSPECGNMAMGSVFEYIPCSPIPYALGSDYFTFHCLVQFGFGSMFHNRAVRHQHTPCRYDTPEKLYAYWKGVAGLIVYQRFYRHFLGHLGSTPSSEIKPLADWAGMRDRVLIAMREYRAGWLRENMRADMEELYELIAMKDDPRIGGVLRRMRAEESSYVDMVNHGIDDHLELLASWNEIIRAAQLVGRSPAFTELAMTSS